jgi:hypothetical protein
VIINGLSSALRHAMNRSWPLDREVVQRLALIGLGRAAGFSLEEIAHMFGPDGRPRIDRKKLLAKADELDARIATLAKLRDSLRHVAACRAPSHLECPTFQRLLRAVTSGVIRAGERTAPERRAPRTTPRERHGLRDSSRGSSGGS